jgi:hypothetical protein
VRQIATNFARLPELLRSATSLVLRRMRLAKLPDLLKTRERDKEGGELDRASVHNLTMGSNLCLCPRFCRSLLSR